MEETKQNWYEFSKYLQANINIIKKSLGSDCTFLSFLTTKELNKETNEWEPLKAFYAIIKNDIGTRDRITIPLEKSIWNITNQDFKDLAYTLSNRDYDTGRAI